MNQYSCVRKFDLSVKHTSSSTLSVFVCLQANITDTQTMGFICYILHTQFFPRKFSVDT